MKSEEPDLVKIARLEEKVGAIEKATEMARVSMEKRLDGMNEFRDTLKDQASKFPTRAEIISFISGAMFLTIAVITLVIRFIK